MQENFYFLCEVEEKIETQKLDDYEEEERFVLEFVTPEHAIEVNANADHGDKALVGVFAGMLERENRVLAIVRNEILTN